MLELTAVAVVTKEEQMRGIIRDRGSEFRVRFLEKIALDLARRIMETRGAVEIQEQMDPRTGNMEMRATVIVCPRDEAMGRRMEFAPRREGKSYRQVMETQIEEMKRRSYGSSVVDAMRYAIAPPMYMMKPMDFGPLEAKVDFSMYGGVLNDKPTADASNSTLTLEAVEKAMRMMDQGGGYNPIDFLKGRIDRKKGIDEALESSKARVRADNQIRNSTKTPGEALPVVKVRVRKIQMPEET